MWWQEPFNAEPPRSALVSSYVTPVHLFYKRNHGPIPIVDHIEKSSSSFILHLQFLFQLLPFVWFWILCFHLPATPCPSPDWSITKQSYPSKISGPCPSTTSLLLYRWSLLFIPISQAFFSVFLYVLKQRSVLVTEELPWAKLGMLEGLDGMFPPLETVLFLSFFLSFFKDCFFL